VARECEEAALAAWKVLGCEDGGRVDLRHDSNGIPNFIEVNPLAGMNPVYSDLPMLSRMNGMDYDELIARIMHSAVRKLQS
jgi:D-alanine-D-alanine ligase